MRRHVLTVTVLWILFSLAGEALVLTFTPFPVAAAEQANLVDDAFTILTILAVPVFAFVSAVLVYAMVRFRRSGEQPEDGPPFRTHTPLIAAWLFITSALTVAIIIHPGITGVMELRADEEVDLLVQVEGRRFVWNVKYPQHNVMSRRELVLPIGAHTQFQVTSFPDDVIHSFWIPAFRVKIDAVPGMFTSVTATPSELGTFDEDANFRLQCAELCGVGHALMRLPVRVVEQDEFDQWIAQQRPIARR